MRYTHILVRYGELFLKGKNRGSFEAKLIFNLKVITGQKQVQRLQGRLVLPYFEYHTFLKRVFGITSYSPAVRVDANLDAIKVNVAGLLANRKGTFKIETNRADKRFPLTSPQINVLVGQFVEEKTPLRFSLKNPDHVVQVEINQSGAFVYTEVISCCGGLPVGVEGKVLVFVGDDAGILAGLLMMKRGLTICPITFAEWGDFSLLQRYSATPLSVTVVNDWKGVEEYAQRKGISVLVIGETFETNMNRSASLLVLKPLIAYNPQRIVEELEKFSEL